MTAADGAGPEEESEAEPIRTEPIANPARVRVVDPEEADRLSDDPVPARPEPDVEE